MLKSELITKIAEASGISEEEARNRLHTIIDCIGDGCAEDGIVVIREFGTFKTSVRKARIGTKPGTGERVHYPESMSVTFKASKALKDKCASRSQRP